MANSVPQVQPNESMVFGSTPMEDLPSLPIQDELWDQVADELAIDNSSWLLFWGQKRPDLMVGKDYRTPLGRVRVKSVKVYPSMDKHPYRFHFSEQKRRQIDRAAKGKVLHVEIEESIPDETSLDNIQFGKGDDL